MNGKMIRVRTRTHKRLMEIKHLIEKRENRSVSIDEIIKKLLDKLNNQEKLMG